MIKHGDEEMWNFRKDIKGSRKEGSKETSEKITNDVYQPKSILNEF